MIGAATAAMLVPASARDIFELPESDWKRWQRTLFEFASPRRYLSNIHTDAKMHLGGIGTGNFEIGADGQFTNWQLFNTLRDGHVPFHFAIKAGTTARLLQTAGGPDWPRVSQIEMTGEYPLATLRFVDEALPVTVELELFSPFTPLDSGNSSIPLAVFNFRVHNPTGQPLAVSLAAMITNPVGYAAIGKIRGTAHQSFGWNVNQHFKDGRAAGLLLRAQSGEEPKLDRSVSLYLLTDWFLEPPDPGVGDKNYAYIEPRDFAIPPLDRPDNLKVKVIDRSHFSVKNLANPVQTIIWLEEAPVDLPASLLRSFRDAVQAGAVLVFSGKSMPLLNTYAAVTDGKSLSESVLRDDILFEDFEHGYGKWTVVGEAFGTEPAHGTLPDQQRVTGFQGKGLANSYVNGDNSVGKLVSQPFTIQRRFIRFLIGGGHDSTTQLRLVLNGKIVRAASGNDNEKLEAAAWDVREFAGQTAHLEIVDEERGGWGHISVDDIVFSDLIGDRATMEELEKILPIQFSAAQQLPPSPDQPAQVLFRNRKLHPDSEESSNETGLKCYTRPVGKGKVALFAGEILDRAHSDSTRARQNAYATLCALVEANYMMTQGQSAKAPGFGSLALASIAEDVTGLLSFNAWEEAWKQFMEQGRFSTLESRESSPPTPPGQTTNGALAAGITVPAGSTVEVPFLLSWSYPNKYNASGAWMGCHYATKWPDASTVIHDTVARYEALCEETKLFHDTVYDSTLPRWLLDCLTANAAIARHAGVVFRIANGDVYGWEGSNGSCQPTCTHVWGYEQALARLFPDLEREMRRIDFKHQQEPDGGIHNRTDVPSPPHPTGERPFADGHASCILKAYREALNSNDESFFNDYWPHVKRAVEYLIHRDARASNGQPSGILQDDQWNTYDEALHGVTAFISGYYLAALRAGEEWARRMNDLTVAERFHEIFLSGQNKLIALCWNGEYFQQYLPGYQQRKGEVGPGCMSDQLIGQWWAHQLGLEYILPREMVVSSLCSIFKHNFKSQLSGLETR
jgi:non-lysosomal glucosylceramidase